MHSCNHFMRKNLLKAYTDNHIAYLGHVHVNSARIIIFTRYMHRVSKSEGRVMAVEFKS